MAGGYWTLGRVQSWLTVAAIVVGMVVGVAGYFIGLRTDIRDLQNDVEDLERTNEWQTKAIRRLSGWDEPSEID